MQLEFWGAAREVTGSMHLLRVGRKNLLIDCGLAQGRRKHAFERNRNLPFDASTIDAVILTHAHIDHRHEDTSSVPFPGIPARVVPACAGLRRSSSRCRLPLGGVSVGVSASASDSASVSASVSESLRVAL